MKIYFSSNSFGLTGANVNLFEAEGGGAGDWLVSALRRIGHSVDVSEQPGPRSRYDFFTQFSSKCNLRSLKTPVIPVICWEWPIVDHRRFLSLRHHSDGFLGISNFVRNAYVKAGYPEKFSGVCPLGVEPEVFKPNLPKFNLSTDRSFKFFSFCHDQSEILLSAFIEEFDRSDNVCLVMKERRNHPFFQNAVSLSKELLKAKKDPPEILFCDKNLSNNQLAQLYCSVDCVVAKSLRSTGWGLMLTEAMACKTPIVTVNYSGYSDFVNPDNAFLVNYKLVEADHLPGKFKEPPYWAEPDNAHLKNLLRYIVNNPEEREKKAGRAYEDVLNKFTWEISARKMIESVEQILESIPIQPLRIARRYIL